MSFNDELPSTLIPAPTVKFFATAAPPAKINDPVLTDVLSVNPLIITLESVCMSPPTSNDFSGFKLFIPILVLLLILNGVAVTPALLVLKSILDPLIS